MKWKNFGEGVLIFVFAASFAAAWIGAGFAALYGRYL